MGFIQEIKCVEFRSAVRNIAVQAVIFNDQEKSDNELGTALKDH